MTTLEIMKAAKAAAPSLAKADSDVKNRALLAMADRLEAAAQEILAANAEDVAAARGSVSEVMLDRLTLAAQRIEGMADGVRQWLRCPILWALCVGKSFAPTAWSSTEWACLWASLPLFMKAVLM